MTSNSWIPDQSSWWSPGAKWQTRLTWKLRFKAFEESALAEIERIRSEYAMKESKILDDINQLNFELSSSRSTITSQSSSLHKFKDERMELLGKLENESSIVIQNQDEILTLRKKVGGLNLAIENHKAKFKSLVDLTEINAKQYSKLREYDKTKLKDMRKLLHDQKEMTTKALTEKKEKIDDYNFLLSELNVLKLSCIEKENSQLALLNQKKDLEKKNSDLEDERSQLDQKCRSTRKLLENEKKMTATLKSHLGALSQQLNIPTEIYF